MSKWCAEMESNHPSQRQLIYSQPRYPYGLSTLENGAPGQIRTDTYLGLNQMPLPVGLQERENGGR